MSALEKAARALFESYSALAYPDEDDIESAEAVWDEGRHGFIESARAVLMAVREPGCEVEARGWLVVDDLESETMLGEAFTAMIDAILADGGGR